MIRVHDCANPNTNRQHSNARSGCVTSTAQCSNACDALRQRTSLAVLPFSKSFFIENKN